MTAILTAAPVRHEALLRPLRRVSALARAEAALLRRNPVALLVAVAMPVLMVVLVKASAPVDEWGVTSGALVVVSITGFTLILGVYYNLVTALVARREAQVLKRLRAGECGDAEVMAGTATPAVVVSWVQVLAGVVVATVMFDLTLPVNAPLVLAGVGLGTALFAVLAVLTAAFTRTVEMAQWTTTPVLALSLLLSGLMVPHDSMPEAVQRAGQFLPLTPVVDLLRLGLAGVTRDGTAVDFAASFAPALPSLMLIVGWLFIGGWAARRWFGWDPRA